MEHVKGLLETHESMRAQRGDDKASLVATIAQLRAAITELQAALAKVDASFKPKNDVRTK